jgi:signal transduction histidine kinase
LLIELFLKRIKWLEVHTNIIVMADNGDDYPFRGRYDLAALTERKLGPVSLQERIVSLGGGVTTDSTESGSRLKITLPLKHD